MFVFYLGQLAQMALWAIVITLRLSSAPESALYASSFFSNATGPIWTKPDSDNPWINLMEIWDFGAGRIKTTASIAGFPLQQFCL